MRGMNQLKMHNKTNEKLKIGVKQTTKAINEGIALKVYVAKDADEYITRRIVELAEEKNVEIVYVETTKQLGRACKIDVGAATAVIVK
jgi:large subunit ribosomal protein L7A